MGGSEFPEMFFIVVFEHGYVNQYKALSREFFVSLKNFFSLFPFMWEEVVVSLTVVEC